MGNPNTLEGQLEENIIDYPEFVRLKKARAGAVSSGKQQFDGALRIIERELNSLLKAKKWDSDSEECLSEGKRLLDELAEIWNDVESWEAKE